MAITASDIVLRHSVAAATGDSTVGTPAGSLGDQVSSTALTSASTGNLFGDVTGDESAAGSVKYRCVFVLNNHATLTLLAAKVEVASQTSGGAAVALALDNIGITAKGSASAQAAVIANELIAPSGVGAFGAGPLTIGDLAPGQVQAVWVRQTTPSGATAANPDGAIVRVSGDTLP